MSSQSRAGSSNNKQPNLNPIYTALDHRQYNRAVKLCLSFKPPVALIVQALLAHSYAKADQKYKALLVLRHILTSSEGTPQQDDDDESSSVFPELQNEIKYALEHREEQGNEAELSLQHISQASASATASKKSGKKGKKKAVPVAAKAPATPQPSATTSKTSSCWDWIEQLETPPSLPENWDECLPRAFNEELLDTTLFGTITMTLSHLNLRLTAYQFAVLIANQAGDLNLPNKKYYENQAYLMGLLVWIASPQRYLDSMAPRLLAQLQTLAIQLARSEPGMVSHTPLVVAWAAQTAMWQFQEHNRRMRADPKAATDSQQLAAAAVLPRLAESLANKAWKLQKEYLVSAVNDDNETNAARSEDVLLATEILKLYIEVYEAQEKWEDQLIFVNELLAKGSDNADESLRTESAIKLSDLIPQGMLLEYKGIALQRLSRFEAARDVWAGLLEQHPDQWTYWTHHFDSDDTDGYQATDILIGKLINESHTQSQETSKYPVRGPQLARLERLARLTSHDNTNAQLLVEQVMEYGNQLSSRLTCTYFDLKQYIMVALKHGAFDETVLVLLGWLKANFLTAPRSEDSRERLRQLRRYIFGIQATYCILKDHSELEEEWLPDNREMLQVWKDFQTFENVDQAQKESRPADELILLSMQQIWRKEMTKNEMLQVSVVLEAGIRYSPYNAYLKIAAMFVYARLNAVPRSWDLFRELYIKHIQYESCSYLILPFLKSAGMYREVIFVCQEILRLQRSSLRDAGEYVGTAMENGALSKANEFMRFQRERMDRSLTTLEAKGLVLDCAPMFRQDEKQDELGSMHGVVGGDEDMNRVCQIVAEAHSPHAAFSILHLTGGITENLSRFTDNRDLSVLSFDILSNHDVASSEEIIHDSLRRRDHHNLLIRSALCLDATKGPKKGKVVRPSSELEKRCSSLNRVITSALSSCSGENGKSTLSRLILDSLIDLSRSLIALSGGYINGSPLEKDTVENREEAVASLLKATATKLEQYRVLADFARSDCAKICGFIPDCLLPCFALFQMNAKNLETFGFGKRKRSTRNSAAALADVSVTLSSIIQDLKKGLAFSLDGSVQEGTCTHSLTFVGEILGSEILERVASEADTWRRQTKARVEKILDSVLTTLDAYDVTD